ncbi:MAG: DUF58 domain-containing protein [Gammaproteobacteria bacterium]|nr:MAG: DUF58 domain-containing protein [Gammaproteobacteria bacterium]
MIPARRSFILLFVVILSALVAVLQPQLHVMWVISLAVIMLVMGFDFMLARMGKPLSVVRKMAGSLPLGVESPVTVKVTNRTKRSLAVRVFDHHPESMQVAGMPQTGQIPARKWNEFSYKVTPTRRGEFEFPVVQIRFRSPLGLWWRDEKLGDKDTVHVYPNFAAVTKYILLATMDRLQQMGIRKRRRRGQGSEFHQLREFRQGDSLRQVDWRATARHRKLISREYQDERDQNIIVLLDCGRRMRTKDDELSHFDHALNAMLLLTYVALRQGDAVGMATFSGERRWLKPVRGAGMLNQVLNAVYDLEPSAEAPDYSKAALEIMARQRKRSLIIVLTNLRDEDGDDLLPALKLLQGRHTVLLASLREQAIDEVLAKDIKGFRDAITLASTHQYLDERSQAINWLQNNGINCLDVAPKDLSVSLVNHYLELKAGSMI